MLSMTAVWLGLLMFVLIKTNNTLNVGRYWKNISALDQNQNGLSRKMNQPVIAALPGSGTVNLPFPQSSGFYQVGFNTLAGFPSEIPNLVAEPKDQPTLEKKFQDEVPGTILGLDGKKISVAGFMIPMDVNDKGKVLSFILAQNRMTCCYGAFPKLNQWIYVKMIEGKTVDSAMDIPLTVFGTLGVGTKYDQDNQGWCLYRMTCVKLDLPRKSWFGF